MFSPDTNLYHPFNSSFLGFFFKTDLISEEINGIVLQNIDLNHQPLPSPLAAIVFFFIKLILVLVGGFVQLKVWFLIKNEKSLTTEVVKVYIASLIVFCPYFIVFSTITDFIHPVNQVIGQWFCALGTFIMYFCLIVITFNSFIVSLMRYLFIVHEEKVKIYGKKKVKKFFLVLSILVPFLINVWRTVDSPAKDPLSYINKCNGDHHRVFLIEASSSYMNGGGFCPTISYDEGDIYGKFNAVFQKISCISRVLITLIMGFNFTEGFIYFKIFSHMMR